MKKIFLAIVLAGSSIAAFAQTQTTFGIKGGVNFAKLIASSEGSSSTASTGSLTSFSAGAFANIPLGSDGLSVQPGLFYTGKGGGDSESGTSYKFKLFYVQLPVHVLYNAPIGSGSKFHVGVGPYAAIGTNGKVEFKMGASSATVSDDIKFGNDNSSDIKRTDFGASGLVGVSLNNGLLLDVNYDLGLSNILPGDNAGGKLKNGVLGISIGYTFK